ncbi:MAG: helix-hairpin-helix domain-containing protein [Actinobacteria bacterium]|nr:helix-hairpin-helix domain-containing protein [Actinomycetota bacterium]
MQLSRRQIYAYVAVAIVVLAVGVRYVVLPKAAGPAGGEPLVLAAASSPPASPAAAASPSASAAADVLVYVCGAVKSPGVVRVPADARVADALALAGGPEAKAELAAVNLAAKVVDGQQIVVPERGAAAAGSVATAAGGSAGSAGGSATVPGAPVNINTASLEELDSLDGVGPATAQKIIDYRTASGPFKTVDEIKNVSGIGDAKFAAMKDSITV